MKATRNFLSSILILSLFLSCQNNSNTVTLIIDDSAVRAVLKNPELALVKRDSIWQTHEGYRQMLAWHTRQSVPRDFGFYEFALNDMLSDNPIFTKDKNYLETINRVQEIHRDKGGIINEHLSSYLPGNKTFTAYAYFIAFVSSYAFSLEDKLVIDIGSPRWQNNPGFILNTVIHEIYHIGYELYTPDKWGFTPKTKDEFLQKTLAVIQNEGMATYIAYKALEKIPSDYKDPDYKLLENQESVDKAFKQTNQLIQDAETANIDSLNEKAWVIGTLKDRAFYVTGSFIAKTIEENHSKEFLVDLVKKGGRQYVNEYNKIANDKRQIEL